MKDGADDRVELALPSHPKYLPLVRAVAEQGANLAGFPATEVERIVLAVTEGVTNVIRHGSGGRTDQPIRLRLDSPPGHFHLEIEDRGTFVDPAGIASRARDRANVPGACTRRGAREAGPCPPSQPWRCACC